MRVHPGAAEVLRALQCPVSTHYAILVDSRTMTYISQRYASAEGVDGLKIAYPDIF